MTARARRQRTGIDVVIAVGLLASAVWGVSPGAGHAEPAAQPSEVRRPHCADGSLAAAGGAHFTTVTVDRVPPPPITAASAAVMDAATGRLIYGLRMNEQRAPASTTKIMTALLSVEAISDQNAVVVASVDATALIDSSVMGLWPSAELSLRDLLYGLMLPSGNDAAIELARKLAPSEEEFVTVMNERAHILGMRNTHFTNPHGLDDWRHYSSAYDMAVLARHAMHNPGFREIASTPVYHLSPPFDYDVYNGNSLLGRYAGADGVKIGWTEAAGWTFVASARRDGREVIVSLMNSADRDADAAALLDWAFASPYWEATTWVPPRPPRLLQRLGRQDKTWLGAACAGRDTAR
jgi:D-alanyl-D-alanine carboxypeptidase